MITIRQVLDRFAKRNAVQGKKQLRSTVPNLLTLGNASFGFLSITQSLQGNVVAAAYCILVAAIFDMLDGRVARYLACVSCLGAELDSLCDVVSFCVAPAIVLYSYCLQDGGSMAVFALILYLCAGLFRLAKFNTLSDHATSFFSGLPTPMAACFLASIVMYHPWLARYGFSLFIEPKALKIIAVGCALLMVSSVPFPSFKRYKITHRHGLLFFFVVLPVAAIGLIRHYPVLFCISFSYISISLCAFFVNVAMRWRVSKS